MGDDAPTSAFLTPDQQKAIDNLNGDLEKILQADVDASLQRDKGSYGFQDQEAIVLAIRSLCLQLKSADWSGVPLETINPIRATVNEVAADLVRMRKFDALKGQNPKADHTAIMTGLRERHRALYERVAPVLAHFGASSAVLARMHEAADEALLRLTEAKTQAETFLEEMRGIVQSAQAAAAQTGVTKHAGLFAAQAREHHSAASRWLIASGAIAAFTAVAVIVAVRFALVGPALDVSRGIQLSVLKVLGFSLLFSALVATTRSYRAHRHNYVVSKHRQNALGTFEAFVHAAEGDAATKNAVLLQATQTIFGPQPTGYMTNEPDAPSYPQIAEIARSMTERK